MQLCRIISLNLMDEIWFLKFLKKLSYKAK